MTSRIEWVRSSCRLLRAIEEDYARAQPFAGLTVGTGIHLEPKTVALLLTLQAGGARVVATGNLNTTQQSAIDYLQAHGVTVVGRPTSERDEQLAYVREVVATAPDLLLDNGGDLFAAYLERPYEGLRGGTEETTSGRMRLEPLRDRLRLPILVINDSPIKQFAENRHAVGQSVLESVVRITNRATNGRRVTVFGYGACGKGVALNFRNAHAVVSVVETDPVTRLEALWDGYLVPGREEALASADLVITVTGAERVVVAEDLAHLKDGAILANAGHFPLEIDVPGLTAGAAEVVRDDEGIASLRLDDGRTVHILAGGHMVNLAGPRPLGNSIESMDIGFALQARCLEAVARGEVGPESCVVPVPVEIDRRVADDYIERSRR
jgi:adenosylhomocysteinase